MKKKTSSYCSQKLLRSVNKGVQAMNIELISLIVPCFNEENTVGEFYIQAEALLVKMRPYKFEIIFINDGSTDQTGQILNNLAAENSSIKVLHLAQNRGHQIALTAGLDHATGDMIVTIDVDLQDPLELIQHMLKKIEGGFDIVHAQRRSRAGETIFKIISANLFYRLLRWFSNIAIIENCGDFRAFTRPVLETVIAFRTPFRFLRGTFVQVGFRQCIIQYDREKRYAGDTKYNFFKMVNLSIDAVLGFSAIPIQIITWLSIFLWSASLIYLIKSLIEHFVLKTTLPGWTSVITLLIFFTGLILFCMAIIGSYVGRIFQHGQNFPLYWLSDARNIDIDHFKERAEELPEIRLIRRTLGKNEERKF